MQRFAVDKMYVAKEALREFVEGYGEGKLEEQARQQQQHIESTQLSEEQPAHQQQPTVDDPSTATVADKERSAKVG